MIGTEKTYGEQIASTMFEINAHTLLGPELREPKKKVDLDNTIVQGDKILHNV